MIEIELYFDFLSPYSFLAYRLARDHFNDSELVLKPVSLPHLINLSGNIPPAAFKPRADYIKKDLARTAAFYQFEPLKVPEKFPFDTRNEMYQLIKMIEIEKKKPEEIDAFVMKTWMKLFSNSNHDINNFQNEKEKEQLKYLLMKNTREALDLGVYGVPFWRVTNSKGEIETFFGSDRFHHIANFLGIDPTQFYKSKL